MNDVFLEGQEVVIKEQFRTYYDSYRNTRFFIILSNFERDFAIVCDVNERGLPLSRWNTKKIHFEHLELAPFETNLND